MSPNWLRFRERRPVWFAVLVRLKRARTKVALLLVLGCLAKTVYWRERPFDLERPNGWVLFGLGIVLVGLALRLAALGHLRKKVHLATTGVYSLCRHPLYLGSILIGYGFCVLLDDIENLIIATGYFALFYPLAVVWEEVRLEQRFGEAYRRYRQRTPALLLLGQFRAGHFNCVHALRNGGVTLIVFTVVLLAAVEALEELIPG